MTMPTTTTVPLDLTGPILIFGPTSTTATVLDALERRLAQGGEVNRVNSILGKLALCEVRVAAEGQGVDVVRWLLDHGADPSGQDRGGNMALHHYLHYGVDVPMIEAVLGAGPDLSRRNGNGLSVLDVAARRWRAEWVQRLVNAGAEVNAANPTTGMTALHQIVADGTLSLPARTATVLQLLLAGADPSLPDAQGRTVQAMSVDQRWWGEMMVTVERRALRDVADETLAAVGRTVENGMPVPMERRERRRLLIGSFHSR